ncbi:hypothetical protein [Calidifontibacter indicus]|uniref:Uncharacterized protein n=1 Tax=Calidifontibacter indicus TaxID=419650 RepID=A0A3D9URE9_9MICO|nr:hypothetical protein [Calidifontibacter indicus]REF29215.1 hypothetical protein DFJ65_0149 [Calidifontibacter indicus]
MDEVTLGDAIDELYAGDPAEFVATRKRLVAAARKQADKELPKTIGALRKPSAAAAAINQLARQEDPPDIPALCELGERMRDAAARMDTAALKELGAERSSLIRELLAETESFGATGAAAKDQLTQTFTAALASAEAEDAVCSGHLVNPLSYSGFGEVEVAEAVAVPLRELQEARLAQLAEREAQRAAKPTRGHDDSSGGRQESKPEPAAKPEPAPAPARSEPAAGPVSAPSAAPSASPSAAPSASPSNAPDPANARAVYEQCVALEQQAQAAVEAARAALATAKEHAAAAGRARQAAEDLLDSLT